MTPFRVALSVAIAACCALGPRPAGAEPADVARIYQGLFGRPDGPATLAGRRGVTNSLSVRVYEALMKEVTPGGAPDAMQHRPGLRAELRLGRSRHRLEYAVSGGVQLEGEPDRMLRLNNQWIEAGARLAVTPRFSLTASPRVAVSPQCVLGLFGTSQLPVDNNLLTGSGGLLSARSNTAWGAAVTAERAVSRRSTLQLAYRHDRLPGATCGVPTADGRASIRFGRRLSRAAEVWIGAMRVGGTNRGPNGAPMTTWLAETRLECRPPAWRRVTLRATASPGRTVSGYGEPAAAVLEGGAGLDFAALSGLRVGGGYERRLSYPQGSARPLPLATWNALAFWSARPALQLTGGFSRSSSTGDAAQALVSLNGIVRADLRVAGTAAYVEYARYQRRSAMPIISVGPGSSEGQALRVGVRFDRLFGPGGRAATRGL